jgi:hypothetical protein
MVGRAKNTEWRPHKACVLLDELIVHGLHLDVCEAKLHFHIFDCLMLAPGDNVSRSPRTVSIEQSLTP